MALQISAWQSALVESAANIDPLTENPELMELEVAPPTAGACILSAGIQFNDTTPGSGIRDWSYVFTSMPNWGYNQGGWRFKLKRHATANYSIEYRYVYDDGDLF